MERRFRNPNRKELQRKAGTRKPFERVLVVCEGEKSEPSYFNEIKTAYRIPTLVTVCTAQKRTEPMQIIETALQTIKADPDFEWVYVVFDRDNHQTYQEALAKAQELDGKHRTRWKKPVRFIAIPSVPCFEFWLLLHYIYRDTRLTTAQALEALAMYLPNYTKGMAGLFQITQGKLTQAQTHAAKLREQFKPDNGVDPYTAVDELIAGLTQIKNRST